MPEQQHEVLLLTTDILHNHHAHVHDVFAHSVQPLVSKSDWKNALAFLLTYWALEEGVYFVHFDVAVSVYRVKACGDEGIELALIAVDDSPDALILVDIMAQIHQLIIGFCGFMANKA